MVGRLAFDMAFLGIGVFFIAVNDGWAQWIKENKQLTERETWVARIMTVVTGLGFIAFAAVDLVLAAMGRTFYM